ncbi:hypothetical protein QFZ51_002083 [Chitinophaga sp. W3I9]|uniref:toxin-antitoxin system YwqK family antitoxin n=1 Tax=Chitinophaga sp. W3I9 TaxID=3373924 RepID=UPI003D209521
MQEHISNCSKLNSVLVFFILLCCVNTLKAQSKVKLCKAPIFVDAIKSGFPHLEESPDTITIREGETYYLRMLLKSCKGAMYLERHLLSNGILVFSGNYLDAVKLDTVQAWAVDPVTGNRTPRTATHYKPLRTGTWKYYDEKGELLKEEKYENGNLIIDNK